MTAARALADSLADDPFYRAIAIDRPESLEAYFQLSLEEGRAVGWVHELAGGAAIWTDPAAPAWPLKKPGLAAILGPVGLANYHRMVEQMTRNLAGLQGLHYLSIVGVAPERQGQGLGASLLAPGLVELDRLGRGSYLETFSERTLAFYERLGFRTLRRFELPDPYWVMVRR